MGVQATTFVAGVAAPTSVFLFSTTLTDPVANYDASGLNWSLAAGQYWLVAMAAVDGTRTFWNPGQPTFAGASVSLNNNPWVAGLLGAVAVRINGTPQVVAAVPEPETWALMFGGLALLGASTRRYRRPSRST